MTMSYQDQEAQAVQFFTIGNWEQAITLYRNCIEEKPLVKENYWYLALCYLLNNQEEQFNQLWLVIALEMSLENLAILQEDFSTFIANFIFSNIDNLDFSVIINIVFILMELSSQQAYVLIFKITDYWFSIGQFKILKMFLSSLIEGGLIQAQIYFWLGNTSRKLAEEDEAVSHYLEALKLNPENPDYYYNLIETYQAISEITQARNLSEQALKKFPYDFLLFYQNFLLLPIIYRTIEEQNFFRQYHYDALKRMINQFQLTPSQNFKEMAFVVGLNSDFLWSYQGEDNLDLQRQFSDFVHEIMLRAYPHLQPLSFSLKSVNKPNNKLKINVGYVSRNLRNQSVGRYFLGWIKHHDLSKFEITCYYPNTITDDYTQEFIRYSDHFHQLPPDIEIIAQQILRDNLDILVYLDIGTEALMTQLSGLKLVPIQCAVWGHPITTASPTIDYFISCDLMEPEDRDQLYIEKLICLPHLGIFYEKPSLPKPCLSRSELELNNDSIIYLSCQSLFKYFPKYDYIFPEIAQRVSNAHFLFVEWSGHSNVTEIFKQRLKHSFGKYGLDYNQFCRILPRLNREQYFSLLSLADVFLDTCEWSGGNTTLDAIICNLPIVTCPGKFMRSRQSYGMLRIINVLDTVADSTEGYITIAANLGNNPDYRANIQAKIQSGQDLLFNNRAGLSALEKFYQSLF